MRVRRELLTERERRVIELRQQRLTQRHIAKELGVTQASVCKILRRTRKHRNGKLSVNASADVARLQRLEATIELGIASLAEVKRALREIDEAKLYRELGYPIFEDYYRERWGRLRLKIGKRFGLSDDADIDRCGDVPG